MNICLIVIGCKSAMKQLSINLDELAFVLHRGKLLDMYCFLNASSGNILSIPSDREILYTMLQPLENPELLTTHELVSRLIPDGVNLLTIPDLFQQNIFDLMSEFIASIQEDNPGIAENLLVAVKEDGYSEFHNILQKNKQLLTYYISYRDRFFETSAIEWLRNINIEVV